MIRIGSVIVIVAAIAVDFQLEHEMDSKYLILIVEDFVIVEVCFSFFLFFFLYV